MVLICLCLTPLALLFLWHLNSDRQDQITQAHHQLRVLTEQVASTQTGQLGKVQTMLRLLADLPAMRSGSDTMCRSHLLHAQSASEFVTAIFVTDLTGKVLCTSADKIPNLTDRSYIKTAITTSRFTLSDYLIGPVSGRPVIIGAQPLKSADGQITGVIAAALDLDWLQQVAQTMAGNLDMSITIIDSQGVIIANAGGGWGGTPESLIGRDLSTQAFIKTVQAKRQGQLSHVQVGKGGPVIVTYSPLNGSSATVIAALSESWVLAPINREWILNFAILTVVFILSLAGAWVFADRDIIVWIDALKEAADRLEAEDFSHPPRVPPQPGELRELALSFVRMGRHLRDIVHLDRLTRLPNKTFLDQHLEELTRKIRETGSGALAILYIDLDGFKLINENYGRLMGDKILRAAAERLRAAMPANGLLARVGGDEFMAVLTLDDHPNARNTAARRAAEQLIKAFASGILLPDEEDVVPLGCSIGLSVWNGGQESLDEVIRDADDALFRAKRQGRHCFMIVHKAVTDVAI